jgi:hypothetical protein
MRTYRCYVRGQVVAIGSTNRGGLELVHEERKNTNKFYEAV